MEEQYKEAPLALRAIAEYFAQLSANNGVIAFVTRITDPVKDDSGVHEQGRAMDLRNEYIIGQSKRWLYPQETVEEIVNAINTKYPRDDGHYTCIHHAFEGGPYHWHIQIPYSWLRPVEREYWDNRGKKNGHITTTS